MLLLLLLLLPLLPTTYYLLLLLLLLVHLVKCAKRNNHDTSSPCPPIIQVGQRKILQLKTLELLEKELLVDTCSSGSSFENNGLSDTGDSVPERRVGKSELARFTDTLRRQKVRSQRYSAHNTGAEYWSSACAVLAQCWRSAGAVLAQCWCSA